MYGQDEIYRTEGTAALKQETSQGRSFEPRIIKFGKSSVRQQTGNGNIVDTPIRSQGNSFVDIFRNVLNSSEMYCSLRYESMSGCPYNVFTKGGIATLSSVLTVLALIEIALSA